MTLLTDALMDANIGRDNTGRVATIIVRAICSSAGAALNLRQREPGINAAVVAEEQKQRIAAVIIELVRLRYPAHG